MKRKRMYLAGLFLLGLFLTDAHAATYTFDGNITYHNDIATIDFTVASDATDVIIWTDSFQSGDNFDPILTLWSSDGSGGYTSIYTNDDNPTIASGQTSWDAGLEIASLNAGDYIITIAVYKNYPYYMADENAVGATLSDGFKWKDQTAIELTSEEWGEESRTGHSVDGYYRVKLSGLTLVPVPGTIGLLGLSLLGLSGLGRRKKYNRT